MPAGKVYLVDDDERVTRALTRALRVVFDVESFASSDAFLSHSGLAAPSCALLDLRIADGSGLDVQHALGHAHPSIKVVFLTGQGDVTSSVRAMKAGAFDFLEKPVETERLMDTVGRAVDASRRGVRPRARATGVSRPAGAIDAARASGLRPRRAGPPEQADRPGARRRREDDQDRPRARHGEAWRAFSGRAVRLVERASSIAASTAVPVSRHGGAGHDVASRSRIELRNSACFSGLTRHA